MVCCLNCNLCKFLVIVFLSLALVANTFCDGFMVIETGGFRYFFIKVNNFNTNTLNSLRNAVLNELYIALGDEISTQV